MNTPEKFWAKVEKTETCWLWRGSVGAKGYGKFFMAGVSWLAHRLSYFLTHGSIPDGMEIDHTCFNKICVNPSHIEAVSRQENMERWKVQMRRRKACKRGHPWTDFYTTKAGSRVCRFCLRERI